VKFINWWVALRLRSGLDGFVRRLRRGGPCGAHNKGLPPLSHEHPHQSHSLRALCRGPKENMRRLSRCFEEDVTGAYLKPAFLTTNLYGRINPKIPTEPR